MSTDFFPIRILYESLVLFLDQESSDNKNDSILVLLSRFKDVLTNPIQAYISKPKNDIYRFVYHYLFV